jgi:hypothetical protein
MNLFFDTIKENVTQSILTNIIEHFNIENCYFTLDERLNSPLTKGATLNGCYVMEIYNDRELARGIYNEEYIFTKDCPPVDEKLLLSMSVYESTIMKMLERTRGMNDQPDYEERVRLYHTHLRYWNYMLDAAKIDFAVFFRTPHGIYNYVIYCLCKIKGIPVAISQNSPMPGFAAFYSDINKPCPDFPATYNRLAEELKETPIDEIKLELPEPQRAFELYSKRSFDLTPLRVRLKGGLQKTPKRKLRELIIIHTKRMKDNGLCSYVKETCNKAYRARKNKNTRKAYTKKLLSAYDALAVPADFSKPYVYFALHYQPEKTTLPMGGVFVHQYLAVSMISFYLPEPIQVYVKEHPAQAARTYGRDVQLYNDLIKLPNVKLISRDTDTYQLIENSIAVATITGTVSLEGQFMEKPCLMFGAHGLKHAPGVFNIRNNEDCKDALDYIVKHGAKHTLKDMKIYFKAVEAAVPHCSSEWIDKYIEIGVATFTEEENINRLTNGLLRVIEEQLTSPDSDI